jgi:hypothetical protein
MDLDLADTELVASARRWLRSLDDATVTDFAGLVRSSPGYFPTTLYALWSQELARRDLTARPSDQPPHGPGHLPVEHPQDSDWRFVPASASALLDLAADGLTRGEGIAHIGTHSTFHLAVQARLDLTHLLLDRNRRMIDTVAAGLPKPHRAACVDLTTSERTARERTATEVARGGMRAAILDPPWYPSDTAGFLRAAASCCATGARLVLCQPTLATRPGVGAERDQLRRHATELGLEVSRLLPGFVRYATPHFEAMSLRTTLGGLPIPPDWRTGDVMILTKHRDIDPGPVRLPAPEQAWTEVQFGPVRIKLRQSQSASDDADLASIVDGDRLPTVSRRDRARPRIGLWTSGNRVYGVSDPDPIAVVITCCGHDLADLKFTHARTMRHCADHGLPAVTGQRLFDLLVAELQEHWLMGRRT